MLNPNLPIAFLAGVVSFFAPCVIPLLPAYVGYVTGVSVQELQAKGYHPYRQKMIVTSILYILGFSLVFVILGTGAGSLGSLFRSNSLLVQRIGGLIILILGLEFAGIVHIPILARTKQFQLPAWTNKLGYARAFFIGVIFATAWTPCVGAVLGSILSLAATTGHAAKGAILLFVYSLGISVPFMIVSLTLASAPKYIKAITTHAVRISKFAGIILAILGVLLLTDTYKYFNSFIYEFSRQIGWEQFIIDNF